jgi:hypothetical protein
MSTNPRGTIDDLMVQRVCGEFLEMPGLRLTCAQAQRLWNLDQQTCRELLELLVETKFLCRPDHGTYSRTTDGPTERPRLRTARARLDHASLQALKDAV